MIKDVPACQYGHIKRYLDIVLQHNVAGITRCEFFHQLFPSVDAGVH